MFPLCFVHGAHGIRSDREYGDHPAASVGRAAPRRRLIVASLSIIFVAMVALAGCESPERSASAAPPAASAFRTADIPGPDFDAMFDNELP